MLGIEGMCHHQSSAKMCLETGDSCLAGTKSWLQELDQEKQIKLIMSLPYIYQCILMGDNDGSGMASVPVLRMVSHMLSVLALAI